MIRFAEPLYLVLLLPVAAGLWFSWRHVHGLRRWRKGIAFGLRGLLATCLILALAGPESVRANVGVCTIFVLDHSDSVPESARKAQLAWMNEALGALREGDEAAVIVFGRDPSVDLAPGAMRRLDRVMTKVDGSGTNLAAAIRLASASFPDGKARRIVVVSDGNETHGDAVDAALVAATDDVSVDVGPVWEDRQRQEVSVTSLQAPNESRIGETFPVRVTVDASTRTTGTLVLDRDGVAVKTVKVNLQPGANTFVLQDRLDAPGFQRYRATLEVDDDHDARNNVGAGFVSVRGEPRILVAQDAATPDDLVRALRQQQVRVDVAGPGQLPLTAQDVQRYDAIVFNDFNAAHLTPVQMELIRRSCRDSGVGFAMIGGENSFLPGGYFGTPVAEMLPVDLNIRQRKTFPSTSVLIVADMSGSMMMTEDGVPKVRLAARAAEQTVMLLGPMDRVGVAGSDNVIKFVAPMQDLHDKGAVVDQIRRLSAGGGGIYILPSLQFAERELNREKSKVRHLILLADGADCDTLEGSMEVARRMRAAKITISVVSIGSGEFVPFLKGLAAVGGGHFYLALKASQLPAIFTQDAAVMSRSAIEEGTFLPKLGLGEEALRGIEGVPPLFAYCLTDSRPLARVGMRTHKDDPLLARWQYGLATTLAFTSDAQPRWAARWVGWESFGAFWAQAIRSAMRRVSTNRYALSAQVEHGKGMVELSAKDLGGAPLNGLTTKVVVSEPDGGRKEVPLVQVGPGSYRGVFDATELGTYIATVAEETDGATRVAVSGFSVPYPTEYRHFRPNRTLLERLAQVTGGQMLTKPADAVRPATRVGHSVQSLWWLFALAAALLLPLDVAVRRVALPLGELLAKLRARPRKVPAAASGERLARLHTAKIRATQPEVVASAEAPAKDDPEPTQPAARTASREAVASRLVEAKRNRKSDG